MGMSFYEWCKGMPGGEKLLDEWDYGENRKVGLTTQTVSYGSNKKVSWVCKLGHKWITPIAERTISKKCCPYCTNRKVLVGFNDLSTTHPDLVKDWHPTKNGELKPQMITAGSAKKIWWICPKGHEWETILHQRTHYHSGCPYCSNQKVLIGFNDFCTTHPDLAKDWHPTKNGELKPQMFSYGSEKSVWWMCPKGHEWKTSVCKRAAGNRCPICSAGMSSYDDALIFYLRPYFPNIIKGFKTDWLGKQEIDIFVPDLNIGIEHDGFPWHTRDEYIKNDLAKDALCVSHGITMIRIRDDRNPVLKWDSSTSIMQYTRANKSNYATKNMVVKLVMSALNLPLPDIDCERDSFGIEAVYFEYERSRSMASTCPEVMDEWDFEHNQGIDPLLVRAHSNQKFWWKCKSGHSWLAAADSRSRGKRCPYCSNRKILQGFNDLATTHPELLVFWDYSLNDGIISPQEVMAGSNRKAWWKPLDGSDGPSVFMKIHAANAKFKKMNVAVSSATEQPDQEENLVLADNQSAETSPDSMPLKIA